MRMLVLGSLAKSLSALVSASTQAYARSDPRAGRGYAALI